MPAKMIAAVVLSTVSAPCPWIFDPIHTQSSGTPSPMPSASTIATASRAA